MLRTFCCLCSLFTVIPVLAQTQAFSGRVIDHVGAPLPLTYVEVVGPSFRGTSSNTLGVFEVQVGPEDSLRFSHIGFEARTVAVSDIRKQTVQLEYLAESLGAALVIGFTGETLLDQMLSRLPENHAPRGYHTGFYRMSGMMGDRHLQISEAILGINPKKDRVEILKTRSVRDAQRLAELTFGVRTETVRKYDVAAYPDTFFPFSKKGRKHHRYWVDEQLVDVAGRPAYRLCFDAIAGATKPALKGCALVDTATLGLAYLEHAYSPLTMELQAVAGKGKQSLLAMMGISITQHSDVAQVFYRRDADGVWRLSNVSNSAELEVAYTRIGTAYKPRFSTQFAVTGKEKLNIRPAKGARGDMIESVEADASPAFWEDYTVIAAEVDYAELAAEIEARNSGNRLMLEFEEARESWEGGPAVQLDSLFHWFSRADAFHGVALIGNATGEVFRFASQGLNADTSFAIGSIAKSFTAMTALALVEQGKFALDDSIGMYVGTEVLGGKELGHLTFRQLLAHRAGLDHGLDQMPVLEELGSAADHTERVARVCAEIIAPPDSIFRYSNGGYMLLAHVLEHMEEKPFSMLVGQQVLAGMELGSTAFPDAMRSGLTDFTGEVVRYNPSWVRGAGGMASTLNDLYRWGNELVLNVNASQNPRPILPAPELEDYLHRPSQWVWEQATTPYSEYVDWQAGYGMGWMVDQGAFRTTPEHTVVYHPGTEWENHSMLATQPDIGCVIVLVSFDGPFPRYPMTDAILRVMNAD